MGYAEMAVTGCFAGPLFNLLIGLGFSFLRTIIAK
jgi:Ca2+/Na+ antiporter